MILRFDDPELGSRNWSWAENIHAIAPGDENWKAIFPERNGTESVNSWIKSKLHGRKARGPADGANKKLFKLVCAALYNNFVAELAFEQRRERLAA